MSATYRAGQVASLLGVSVDTVRRLADAGQLHFRRSAGGQRVIDGPALAKYVEEQAHNRAREAQADPDVIVGQSARNRFTGIVVRVVKDKVAAQVEMQAGGHRIVSLMTREAADELELEPGVLVVASVKSTNVVIELPRPRG